MLLDLLVRLTLKHFRVLILCDLLQVFQGLDNVMEPTVLDKIFLPIVNLLFQVLITPSDQIYEFLLLLRCI